MRTHEQNAKIRDASNRKIRSAAIKTFAEKGYAATSIQNIADAAGVSIGLMYRHYQSKDELFASLVESAAEETLKIAQSLEANGDPREIIENVVAFVYEQMVDSDVFSDLMVLMSQALVSNSLPDSKKAANTETQIIKSGEKLIKRGQQLGMFSKGNPSEMSILLFSYIQGLFMMKSALGDHFTKPSAELVTSFLYHNLGYRKASVS